MESSVITFLTKKFEDCAFEYEGVECWSARELQVILEYKKWEHFKEVIEKAKISCKSAGNLIENHFPDVGKMVEIGSGAEREIVDVFLTRYACYPATGCS
jgi:DNA-damage-inducible protein D